MTVRVELTTRPDAVRDRAGAWLAAHPYTANIPASVLADLPDGGSDVVWALAFEDGGPVIGVAMDNPGRPAYLPDVPEPVAVAVAEAFHGAGRRPRGVLGDTAAGAAYARRWQDLSGEVLERGRAETLYVLDRLSAPDGVPGAPRPAGPRDVDLVEAWFSAFVVEVFPSAPDPVGRAEVERRVAAGGIVLWTSDGAPVAMSGYRAPAAGVGRVGPVYTPPAARGRGYGAAVTAAATRAVLALGGAAMLFTDSGNPTSNGVYRRIGYRVAGEITRWAPTGSSS